MGYDPLLKELFLTNFNEAYRSSRLLVASYQRIAELLPLNAISIDNLDIEDLDKLDAFRMRFCDLQDTLGSKVFRALLALEQERYDSQLDLLNKIEKRRIFVSSDTWQAFRDIRNLFSHEYPEDAKQRAETINTAHAHAKELIQVFDNVHKYLEEHYDFPIKKFKFLSIELS